MILVDANLLLYAHNDAYREHGMVREWLDRQLNSTARIALPWICLLAFLRISTNPRIHEIPETTDAACTQVERWLSRPNVWTPEPGLHHSSILLQLLRTTGTRGNLTSDAHIAALAIEHGLTICSADADFARFPNVRWMNPLAT